jgi:hypothetical protein
MQALRRQIVAEKRDATLALAVHVELGLDAQFANHGLLPGFSVGWENSSLGSLVMLPLDARELIEVVLDARQRVQRGR